MGENHDSTSEEKTENNTVKIIDGDFKYSSCDYVPLLTGDQDIAIYNVDGLYIFCAPFNQDSKFSFADAFSNVCHFLKFSLLFIALNLIYIYKCFLYV